MIEKIYAYSKEKKILKKNQGGRWAGNLFVDRHFEIPALF